MMHELQPGDPQLVGPYRLHARLGGGGMGQVFLGRSAGGRPVAVKVVHAHLATDPEFRERFRREIAVARKVSGVYTSPVIDADVDGPMPWLATAYVDGPSLADAVSEHGPLLPGSLLALAAGLAEGLTAIHAAGVVHRDLKPDNVLLAEDGPHVIDFGISQAAEASALTRTGLVVGSPGFMSPEQAEGREVGPPSDIFSLGAVLAFAATGQGPFGAGSTPALVYRVVCSPPNLDRLPAEVRPLTERCLAKDPAQRPTAAQVLAEAGAARPGAAATRLDAAATRTSLALPATPATTTATVLGPVHDGPSRRPRRRIWRPLAIASISAGLLAGCTFTGVALAGGSGQITAPPTSSPTPSASASTSTPATVTPATSAPATSALATSAPATSAPATSAPATSAPVTATASPTVTTSASPSPTASVTPTAITTTVAPTGTPATPASPAPVTSTATP